MKKLMMLLAAAGLVATTACTRDLSEMENTGTKVW